MDINIGNDIRIKFNLKNIDVEDQLHIKQMKCMLINTSYKNDYSEHCIHRFPNEPFPQYFNPTMHTIRGCGSHKYHLLPHYHGFGVISNRFDICDKCDCCCNCCHHCEPRCYNAYCTFGKEDLTACAYFPGHDQKRLGKYKMVVCVTIHEEGWGKHNIHEFCIDYGEIFTLVKEGGESGRIEIDLTVSSGDLYIGYVLSTNPSTWNISLFLKQEHGSGTFTTQAPETGLYLAFISSNKIEKIIIDPWEFPLTQGVSKIQDMHTSFYPEPQSSQYPLTFKILS